MKKSFALGMLLASSMLIACGGGSNSSSQATPKDSEASSEAPAASSEKPAASSEAPAEVTLAYQGTASYDELYDMFAAFEFYAELYSDGNGKIYQATVQNSNNLPNVAKDESDEYQYTSFKYKVEEDEGIETMTIAINGSRVECYKNKENQFKFDYSFTFAGSYTRTATLLIGTDASINGVEGWIANVTKAYEGRTKTVTVQETYKGSVLYADGDHVNEPFKISFGGNGEYAAEAKWELNSDFTVKAVYGVGGYGGATFEGSWTVDTENGNVHKVTFGEDTFTGVKQDDNTEVFDWAFVHQAKDGDGNPVGDSINLKAELHFVQPTAE